MASLIRANERELRILDAGAGVGSLLAALVAELCGRQAAPAAIAVTAYEIDPLLTTYLDELLAQCQRVAQSVGTDFRSQVFAEDFIHAGVDMAAGGLFGTAKQTFNCVIMNPPYKKINTDSTTRRLLRHIGVETSNLYTGFLAVAIELLEPGGELVAITPRSFCSGLYFKPFREWLFQRMSPRRFHVFESRSSAFKDDDVLQETVIFHAVKESARPTIVTISSSGGPDDEAIAVRDVLYDRLVRPGDPNLFVHLVPDELGQQISERMGRFGTSLSDLGLTVSTGRVVDFRADDYLCDDPGPDTVPLIYPTHFKGGGVTWPKLNGRKANALKVAPYTEDLLVPPGVYVLVKRFSAKEERRRIVAAVYDSAVVSPDRVGFENHLNYFHSGGKGLPETLARGLATFLNSSLVDAYFRQFNGHTQVNATDLRSLRYPTRQQLEALGAGIGGHVPSQGEIDSHLEGLLSMKGDGGGQPGHMMHCNDERFLGPD
jgi:adenine-specific DNA-methyltransferase